MTNNEILAWHFLKNDCRTGEGNIQIFQGQTLTVDGQIELCNWGLHWSIRPLDAIGYAPGSVVQRVRVSGDIIYGDDKGVSSERTCLWLRYATRTLHEFALWVAEDMLTKNNISNSVLWKALEVKRLWLDGLATDEELDAAAYETAAYETVGAAYSAAYSAASSAASKAAYYAASRAAYGAAYGAEYDEYSAKLEEMLLELE